MVNGSEPRSNRASIRRDPIMPASNAYDQGFVAMAADPDPERLGRMLPARNVPDAWNRRMTPPLLRTDELDYELPERLIATRPAVPRDSARMLVMSRSSDAIEHRHVRDLPEYLMRDDVLIMNDTAVTPARLFGRRSGSGGRIEGLFLEEIQCGRWRMMLRSNGRLRAGTAIELTDRRGSPSGSVLMLLERDQADWIVRLEPVRPAAEALDAVGWTPLPPYIVRARGKAQGEAQGEAQGDDDDDRRWYQTVYANEARRESVAAPTAGLHFTPELMDAIEAGGVERALVTLHVGPGTFRPITAATVQAHDMHRERFDVPAATIDAIGGFYRRREAGGAGRLFAVGTTTVRALESLPQPWPASFRGATELLIAPPYQFRLVEGLLTNFHLPRSTLLALVGALVGLDRLKAAYREAIARQYRFFSYGDAMLILP